VGRRWLHVFLGSGGGPVTPLGEIHNNLVEKKRLAFQSPKIPDFGEG